MSKSNKLSIATVNVYNTAINTKQNLIRVRVNTKTRQRQVVVIIRQTDDTITIIFIMSCLLTSIC